MKFKSQFHCVVLTAVWLAGWLPAGRCQIIGYLALPIAAGYNFVANPFDTADNTLASVVSPSFPPLGTAAYLWNVTNQQYAAPALYSSSGWSTNFGVPPGTGFVLSSTSAWTLTFTGTVLQGSRTNLYAGGGQFSLLASHFPTSEALTGPHMTFPGLDGENVFLYDRSKQDFSDAFTYYAGYGWFDPDGIVGTAGPVINAGQSFFAQNLGASTSWIQTYGGSSSQLMSQPGVKASFQRIQVAGGKVILSILNRGGSPYSVQFSADGSVWTTLAGNLTGRSWTGPVPDRPQGFYRLSNP